MALELSDLDRELADGVHGGAAAFAMRLLDPLRRGGRRALLHRHRAGACRRLSLSRPREPRFRRAHGRARRPGPRADEPQRRLARSHPSRAVSRLGRGARERRAAHAGACGARLRADLHLRPLSDGASARIWRADRLGRVECDRLRQFRHRREDQPLRRLHRSLLRDDRPRAGIRPASDRKPARPGDRPDRQPFRTAGTRSAFASRSATRSGGGAAASCRRSSACPPTPTRTI